MRKCIKSEISYFQIRNQENKNQIIKLIGSSHCPINVLSMLAGNLATNKIRNQHDKHESDHVALSNKSH